MIGRSRAPRALVLGLLVALVASWLVMPMASAGTAGLELRSTQELSPRLTELRVHSPALAHDANVRVLTPDGFVLGRDHLPVLWLLHGGFGSSADWTTVGDAEALTADLPMIVVMPDAGTGGWYTDWWRGTPEGPQRWETFHLDELRPFIGGLTGPTCRTSTSTTARAPLPGRTGKTTSPPRCRASLRSSPELRRCRAPRSAASTCRSAREQGFGYCYTEMIEQGCEFAI